MATDQSTKPRELADQQRAMAVRALLESASPPMIEKSIDAFRRDLPEMLETRRGKWVAYHGDERIGFGNSQTELYRKCFGLGLTRDDFVVCGVDEGTFDPDAEVSNIEIRKKARRQEGSEGDSPFAPFAGHRRGGRIQDTTL